MLNGDLTIASDLDVFERVGRGVAHDEYIEFEVKSGKIIFRGHETEITEGKTRVDFIKKYRDNPKVNAIILSKGRLSGKYIAVQQKNNDSSKDYLNLYLNWYNI